jgi:hypothetical protein
MFRRSQNPSQQFNQREGAWLLIHNSFRLHCSNIFKLFVASEAQSPEMPKSKVNLHRRSMGECEPLDP